MNKLSTEKRTQILGLLVEGMGVRATARLSGCSPVTILKFLKDMGEACADYQDKAMKNLKCKRIQVDEIWSFVYAKAKNAPEKMKAAGEAGDMWVWVAIDADTKLVPCFYMGQRNAEAASILMEDLALRLSNRIQLTTDGHKAYLEAVEGAFEQSIYYAMLIKLYGEAPEGTRRYSPAQITGIETKVIMGNPKPEHVSTSFVERQNLTMRMGMRRFTRLTNGFSKKTANHYYTLAIHYMYYNFVRVHQTLRVSPAMAAGVTNHLWNLEEMVNLLP